jgi:heme exporter protein D
MNFTSWHDFFYMGGHYLYVWLSYAIGIAGIAAALLRPLAARRRFFRIERQQARRAAAYEAHDNASDPA